MTPPRAKVQVLMRWPDHFTLQWLQLKAQPLVAGQQWRMVADREEAEVFDTYAEAAQAAKEFNGRLEQMLPQIGIDAKTWSATAVVHEQDAHLQAIKLLNAPEPPRVSPEQCFEMTERRIGS